MTLTLEMPPELEERARRIPDLQEQVISFVRGLADLEQWREGRYSERARRLVEESRIEAERCEREGYSREEVMQGFEQVMGRISEKLR